MTSIMEEVFRPLLAESVYDKHETEGELIDPYLMIEFEFLFETLSRLDQV